MVTSDGKPIKSDSDHQHEHGSRISVEDGQATQTEYFFFRESSAARLPAASITKR